MHMASNELEKPPKALEDCYNPVALNVNLRWDDTMHFFVGYVFYKVLKEPPILEVPLKI